MNQDLNWFGKIIKAQEMLNNISFKTISKEQLKIGDCCVVVDVRCVTNLKTAEWFKNNHDRVYKIDNFTINRPLVGVIHHYVWTDVMFLAKGWKLNEPFIVADIISIKEKKYLKVLQGETLGFFDYHTVAANMLKDTFNIFVIRKQQHHCLTQE
jgi:hypothetical protein